MSKNYYVSRLVEHSGHKHGWLFMSAEIFKEIMDTLRDTPSINDIKTVEWKNIRIKLAEVKARKASECKNKT